MIGIEAIEFYMPNFKKHITEMKDALDIKPHEVQKLTEEYKINKIAIEETLLIDDMMTEAVNSLFKNNAIKPSDVELILFTHSIPQLTPFLWDPLSKIKKQFNLENVQSFSIGQLNCASLDYLFLVCQQWLTTHPNMKGILFISADKMFIQNFRYLKDSSVMGDAAVCGFITPFATKNYILSSRLDVHATIYNGEESSKKEFEWFQRTFTMGLVKILRKTLMEQDIALSKIKHIFPSNVNFTTWEKVSGMLKIPIEKFYFPTLSEVGHAHNADALLNYQNAFQNELLKPGDYFATLTVGMGSTFGCTLFMH